MLRPKEQLKALIVVANPIVDPKQHLALAAIDGAAEIARARDHLARGGIEAEVVKGARDDHPVARLFAQGIRRPVPGLPRPVRSRQGRPEDWRCGSKGPSERGPAGAKPRGYPAAIWSIS